jgi:hypothetical protein
MNALPTPRQRPSPVPGRLGRCTVELLDGRVIDLTGLTVEEVTDTLNSLQITPADIKQTIHVCDLGLPPRVQ